MTGQQSDRLQLDRLWVREGVWYRSPLVRDFLKRAQAQYPRPQSGSKAAWPEDEEGIGQNLAYFFTGNLLKLLKIMCTHLCEAEAVNYLSEVREITVLDMACGAGTASIALIDFLHQAMAAGVIQRPKPLTISFVLNDLNASCVMAARKSLDLVRQKLHAVNSNIQIGSVLGFAGSISEIVPFLKDSTSCKFDFLFLCNAFDQVLVHGHRILEKNPHSTDPIASARPCDRPALLANLFTQLGNHANLYFSRVIFLQESRHYSLISVALPGRELGVTRTWMVQETDRPDVSKPTMNVRFGYFCGRYGFSNINFSSTPELQPLATQLSLPAVFSEPLPALWFDEELSVSV